MPDNITLKRGEILIIAGQSGSANTDLARIIAKAHGSFRETTSLELATRHDLYQVLKGGPTTLIIEDLEAMGESLLMTLKELSSNNKILCCGKQGQQFLPTPSHVIVCTSYSTDLSTDDRRFRVITLEN